MGLHAQSCAWLCTKHIRIGTALHACTTYDACCWGVLVDPFPRTQASLLLPLPRVARDLHTRQVVRQSNGEQTYTQSTHSLPSMCVYRTHNAPDKLNSQNCIHSCTIAHHVRVRARELERTHVHTYTRAHGHTGSAHGYGRHTPAHAPWHCSVARKGCIPLYATCTLAWQCHQKGVHSAVRGI